jgi:hypothetical protein
MRNLVINQVLARDMIVFHRAVKRCCYEWVVHSHMRCLSATCIGIRVSPAESSAET